MKKHFTETIISNELIAYNTYLMKINCPGDVARWFRPGQFAHIALPGANDHLLRRPISINYVDREEGSVHIAYCPVGEGTRMMAALESGQELDVLMPLGNGFLIRPEMKKIWLVGGGIGCAPLKSLFAKFPDREYKAFLGFRNADSVYQEDDFKKYAETFISTDDGSYSTQGFCTSLLAEQLRNDAPDVILSCGPLPFFRALSKVTGGVPTQVSMEQHMGCGTGGCSTCVCKIGGEYKRVCVQGPVFDIKEVDALYA